ncbi:MAG: hypothetical protein RBS56_00725 [Candidatus Gracilibacteria bacterium]|jgi:hypothetical protein|nr:hypothetical protein [Candidatus Gracilibacteria bacterium]
MLKYVDNKNKKVNIKKAIIYTVLAILSLIVGLISPSVFMKNDTSGFLRTSMFQILDSALSNANNLIDEAITTDSDLALSKVILRKIPDGYETVFKVKNEGSFVKNLDVMLANDLTKDFVIVKNSDNGLTLNPGEELIVNDYDFQMDKNFSGGDINFYLKILNENVFEAKTENNFYKVSMDEYRPTVDDFFISSFSNDQIVFDYEINDFLMNEKSFEILISNKLEYSPIDEKYREAFADGRILPYSEIPLSDSVFESGNFKMVETQDMPVSVNVFKDGLYENTDKTYYLMLKINFGTEKAHRFKYSNILKLSPIEYVDSDDLSALLSDMVGGVPDVSHFSSEELLRGETVKFLFEYFETDMESMQSKKLFFKDLKPGNDYYQFAQALKKFNFATDLSEYFAESEKINKELILRIINELKGY